MHWWLLNLLIILRITNSQVCHSRDEHTSETSTELRNNILEKKNILHIICIRSQQTKYIHVHYINHIYIYVKSLQYTLSIPNKNAINKPMNSFHSQVVITEKTPYAVTPVASRGIFGHLHARRLENLHVFGASRGSKLWVPITWALQGINPTYSIQCEFI